MSLERCPKNKKGERNLFCLHYGECLNDAAKKLWAFLDCSECEYKSNRDSKTDITEYLSGDSMQIHDLPSGIDEF